MSIEAVVIDGLQVLGRYGPRDVDPLLTCRSAEIETHEGNKAGHHHGGQDEEEHLDGETRIRIESLQSSITG